MIKPIHAVTGGTLVANPRRKRRKSGAKRKNPGKRFAARAKTGKSGKRKHAKRAKTRNPSRTFGAFRKAHKARGKHTAHRNPARRGHKRRNPEVGGIDIMELALGSGASIALTAVTQALVDKYAPATIKTSLGAASGALAPGLVAVAAFFAHKKAKGKIKGALKYVAITATFEAVNQVAGSQIKGFIQDHLPGTGGMWLPNTQNTGGMWLPNTQNTGGAWMGVQRDTRGAFPAPTKLFGVMSAS